MRYTQIAVLVLGFGILLGLQTVAARTVTQSTGGSNGDGCRTDVVTFDQAHLAPGETLTSISMRLGGTMNFDLASFPDAEFPSRVALSAGVMLTGPGIPDKPECQTSSFDLINSVDVDVFGVVRGVADMGTAFISPTLDNAAYIGPGTVQVFVTSDTDDTCRDVFCLFDMDWGLTLTFDIAQGPRIVEPSSMSLLLGAGTGFIGLARRRSAKPLIRPRPASHSFGAVACPRGSHVVGLISTRHAFSFPWSCAAVSTARSRQVPVAGCPASAANAGVVASV